MDQHSAIADGARRLGISIQAAQADALFRHLALVYEANESMSLTSICRDAAVALHVLDSLTALAALERAAAGAFADLGSGPGFPGVPLAVMSGRRVALVESVRKKAMFLERVAAELCLEATVHPIRAESLAVEMPCGYSAVVARALSSLPSLVELAAPLLETGGLLVCMKGRLEERELFRGDTAAALCGLRRESTEHASIPGLDVERSIVTYSKSSWPQIALPRRHGMAQRQPLA
jgi:16S rRNA (guanine527-N7)-methyltransferase